MNNERNNSLMLIGREGSLETIGHPHGKSNLSLLFYIAHKILHCQQFFSPFSTWAHFLKSKPSLAFSCLHVVNQLLSNMS